jgi:hypothetical protein
LCRAASSQDTGNIDYATTTWSDAESVRSRLNALSNIANSASDDGTNGVVVTRTDYSATTNEGYVFSVTFSGAYVPGSVPLLTVKTNDLGGQTTTDGTPTITIAQLQNGTRPGFKLSYNGAETGCIAYDNAGDPSVVDVERRLEALVGITAVAVTKTNISGTSYRYTIVFSNPSTPISLVVPSSISNCDALPAAHDSVVTLDTTHGLGDGTMTLRIFCNVYCSWGTPSTSTSTDITFNALQGDMGQSDSLEANLNAIVSATDATKGFTVTRTPFHSTQNEGYVFSVTFSGSRVEGDMPQMQLVTATPATVTTDNTVAPTITMATTTEGSTGGYKLKYNTLTSECLPYTALGSDSSYTNENDTTILDRIKKGLNEDVTVSRASTSGGHRYTVAFASGQSKYPLKVDATGCEDLPTGTPAVHLDFAAGTPASSGVGLVYGQNNTVSFTIPGGMVDADDESGPFLALYAYGTTSSIKPNSGSSFRAKTSRKAGFTWPVANVPEPGLYDMYIIANGGATTDASSIYIQVKVVASLYVVIDKDGNGLGSYNSQSFTLSFDTSGNTTSDASYCALCLGTRSAEITQPIDWDVYSRDMSANIASLQNRLGALSNIGSVVVNGPYHEWWNEGHSWRITFGTASDPDYWNNGNVPSLTLGTDSLGGQTVSEPGASSSDRFQFHTIRTGRDGAFRFMYDSVYTRCIPWNANGGGSGDGNLQDFLIAHPSITSVNVTRAGSNTAYAWTISFYNPSTPQSLILEYPSSACGGTFSCHGGNVCDGQTEYSFTPFNLQGTFQVSFDTTPNRVEGNCSLCTSKAVSSNSSVMSYVTDNHDLDAIASALGAAFTIGSGNVTVTGTSPWNGNTSSIWEGYVFSITFSGVAVQSDVPLLKVSGDSVTGDELGLHTTVPAIQEEVKGNHAGFKMLFQSGKRASYCIGHDAPNSEFQYGDLRSWEKNLARSPTLDGQILNAVVEKNDLEKEWFFKFEDTAHPVGDIRRKNPTVIPVITLDDECDHAVGGILNFSSITATALGGNLSRIDLNAPLLEKERIYVGDQLSFSTSYNSPGPEDLTVTVVQVVNATRIVVDPPFSTLTDSVFTIKRLVPSQKAVIVSKPCDLDVVCPERKYPIDRSLRKVTSVALRNVHAGTKEAIECSGKGNCDYRTGLCKCYENYGKADCSFRFSLP